MLTKPGVDLVDGGEVVVPGLGPPSGPVELSALSVVALVAAAGEDRIAELAPIPSHPSDHTHRERPAKRTRQALTKTKAPTRRSTFSPPPPPTPEKKTRPSVPPLTLGPRTTAPARRAAPRAAAPEQPRSRRQPPTGRCGGIQGNPERS
eukprot:scaffold23370_cov120-Isochrysis_galbana.AAC.8